MNIQGNIQNQRVKQLHSAVIARVLQFIISAVLCMYIVQQQEYKVKYKEHVISSCIVAKIIFFSVAVVDTETLFTLVAVTVILFVSAETPQLC